MFSVSKRISRSVIRDCSFRWFRMLGIVWKILSQKKKKTHFKTDKYFSADICTVDRSFNRMKISFRSYSHTFLHGFQRIKANQFEKSKSLFMNRNSLGSDFFFHLAFVQTPNIDIFIWNNVSSFLHSYFKEVNSNVYVYTCNI